MGLTYRNDLNRPLNIDEIDNNIRYFTGSHSITGSLTISGSEALVITGSVFVSGNIIPNTNPNVNVTSSYDLGSETAAWRHVYVSNGSIIFLSGSTGNITSSSFSAGSEGIQITTNMLPAPDTNVSLGSEASPFTDLNIGLASVNFISSSRIIASIKTSGEDGVGENPATKGMIFVQNVSSSVPRGSFGIGANPYATGIGSFSQGASIQSLGAYSHAQGLSTRANANYSHAEGSSSVASGIASHAEGISTLASGLYSHAEGSFTTASGVASHAEGAGTVASANYSHAGGLYTVASGSYQAVIGSYNLASLNSSAFIIGNGTNVTRKNLLYASGSNVQITGSLIISGTLNVTNGLNAGNNIRLLQEFEDGTNFGSKLQTAINTLNTGSIIDCTYYTGSQTISSSITINKPITILLGNSDINVNFTTYTTSSHAFTISNTSGVIIKGLGRSPKSDTQLSPTRVTMANTGSGYHIFGTGSNGITIQDLDLVGVQSSNYNLTTGAGGVCFLEPNPGVSQAGNTINNILLSNLFIDGTRDHGIYFVGSIMSNVKDCRISNAGGHGFFTTEGSTSTKFENCYASSGKLAGFCIHNTSYSTLENCAAENFGAGYWIRSAFNISLIGCGAEMNKLSGALPNSDLGITFGGYLIDDWTNDFKSFISGSSYVLTGGKNIVLNNPYSKDPGGNGQAYKDTSHFTIASTNSGSIIMSPRCMNSDGPTLNYDILVRNTSGAPRDLSLVFNPETQGTVTPTSPGQYITTTYNPGVNNTVICDEGINTEVKSGNKFYNTIALPNFTSSPTNVTTGSMYLNPSTNTLYIYNGTTWRSASLS